MLTALVLGLAVCGLTITVQAEDKKTAAKEVTLKGSITCAKCDLGIEKKCATVIKVEDRVVYFDMASNKKYHADTCQAAKMGEVSGLVTKVKDKETIKISKLKYAE